jgi:hypothetical protein
MTANAPLLTVEDHFLIEGRGRQTTGFGED